MYLGKFEDAASSFYQAMVGADEDSMKEAQSMVKVAVNAARAEKGLGLILSSSDSDDDDDY